MVEQVVECNFWFSVQLMLAQCGALLVGAWWCRVDCLALLMEYGGNGGAGAEMGAKAILQHSDNNARSNGH